MLPGGAGAVIIVQHFAAKLAVGSKSLKIQAFPWAAAQNFG
jgi:hypothetical protein